MRVACLGGGPAGLYFAITMKLRNPDHEIVVIERNRPDDTFGWGVVLSDETLDNLAQERSGQRRLDPRAFRLLGRHRGQLPRHADRVLRPRLLRHRPQDAAHPAAAAGARARRRPPLRDGGGERRDLRPRLRSRRRRRRAEFEDPRASSPRTSSPRSTSASASSSGSARTRNSTTPSPSSSRRRSTAGCGRTPISSTTTRRPSSSSAPRRPGRSSASAR